MTIFDPFLFAGTAQIEEYQNQRIKRWEGMKGDSKVDFNHYFEKIKEKWNIDLSEIEEDSDINSEIDADDTNDTNSTDINTSETIPESEAAIEDTNEAEHKQLTAAGVYIPEDANAETTGELSEEERKYIKLISLLEWNIMMMGRRSIHKSRVKSTKKRKEEKKEGEREDAQFQAKLEAIYRAKNKERSKPSKKKQS